MIWFLWSFAIFAIVRWFHVISLVNEDWETTTEFVFEREPRIHVITYPLSSN